MYKQVALLPIFLLVATLPFEKQLTQTVQIDSIHQQNLGTSKPDFYDNPLVLNGKPLDYTFFSLSSRGNLALVLGDPESEEAVKIPFRIYLMRDGIIIPKSTRENSQEPEAIDISPVMALARPGDELVIEPIRKTDWQGRRSIRLQPTINWLFPRPNC